MDNLALLLNKAKMDVTEEVIDIIPPGRALGVHTVWEDGQFFNLFFIGARILIVDDDAAVRDILFQILTTSNYLVTMAVDGFDAGIKVSEFKPELILMDLVMPGMDGVEACRRIKDNPDTSGIKVLMITGFDTPENREKAKQAGADGYLLKPIDMDVLLEKVKDLLSMPLGHS
ncbi:MAG: response regulator [Deltaproteobacteria bacterium]|jgi:CheY-like chemotaxis protein|nr:response regulator [Deltaproteobacteria bacterium]